MIDYVIIHCRYDEPFTSVNFYYCSVKFSDELNPLNFSEGSVLPSSVVRFISCKRPLNMLVGETGMVVIYQ